MEVNEVRRNGNALELIVKLGNLVLKCCEDDLSKSDLTSHDIHYSILCLQGEKAKVIYGRSEELSKINFKLYETDVTMQLQSPTLDVISDILAVEDPEIAVYEMIDSCIDIITIEDECVKWKDETEEEKILFFEVLPEEVYVKIAEFFLSRPSVEIETE
jgi:hypothetical protein